jgi:hypothetical protein
MILFSKMRQLLILIFLSIGFFEASSQISDIISVRKKNGTTIKTFVTGTPILFQTKDKMYIEGTIRNIRNDSIFIMVYDIRTVLTRLGVTVVDTVSRHVAGLHYSDMERIKVYNYRRFVRGKMDKLLMIGGAGYFGLNVVNGAYLQEPITSRQNLQSLGISVGAFGLGWLIKKFFPVNRFSRRKHKIVYIKLH